LGELAPAAAQAAATPAAAARPLAPPGFTEFFRASFRELVKTAMYAGATREEAEDAVAKTLESMLRSWSRIDPTLAYARKAVVNNFIQSKTRGPARVARRLVERGHVPHQEGAEDRRLAELEARAWLADVLSTLPPAQRKVMQCIADGIDRAAVADQLGMSKEAVRRNLCDARKRLAAELHPDGEHKHPSPPAVRKEAR
jgi:RNA polymerase sigma factor (sigma-70 family)